MSKKSFSDCMYEFVYSINENYVLHRVLFCMNISILIKVPIKILFLHQCVETMDLFCWLLGALYITICWKNFKWDQLFRRGKKDE